MATPIIGLSGTNGSGKDTVGMMLAEKHGFMFVSVSELLRDELRKRGLPIIRDNTSALSAEWRREFGYGVLIDKAVALYEETPGDFKGLVMASLRNPAEADRIHELGGQVWWIDADPRTRYERIQANAMARGRAGEDNKTYEQFQAEEEAEMHQSGDAATLNMSAVRDKSDIKLVNGGNDLALLEREIGEQLY